METIKTTEQLPELANKVQCVPAKAEQFIVTSNGSYELAVNYLKDITALKKEVLNTFDPIVKKAHEAHKTANEQKKKHLLPLENSERVIKGKINVYLQEQERIRREKQRELEEKERRARAEEQKRLADEQKKREDEALKNAADLEASGDKEAAEKVLEEVQEESLIDTMPEAAPVQVQKSTPEIEGVHTRKVTKWEVKDQSKIKPQFMTPDIKKIGGIVRSSGTDAIDIVGPGIRVWIEETVVTRS